MEPYLSRIGDITIERVAPRRLPQPPVSVQPPPVPEDPPPEEPQDEEEQEMRDDSSEAAEEQDMEVEKSPEPKDTGESVEEEKDEGDEAEAAEEEQQQASSSSEDDSQEETADKVESPTPEETEEGKEKDSESSSGPTKDSEMPQEARDGDSEGKTEGEGESKTEGDGSKEESKKRKCDDGSSDDKSKKKKKKHKKESKKQDGTTEGEKDSSSDSDDSNSEDKDKKKVERKSTNLRRNIREVMDESELDEETKAAQRQEMERLRRVQEQQRIIREVQRQIMMQNKQRGRPSISLQSSSSLLRQCTITTTGGSSGSSSSGAAAAGSSSSGVRIPSSVLMKLAAAGGDKKVIEMLTSGKTPQSRSSRSSSQESGGGVSILRTSQHGEELGSESDDEAELDDDDIGVLSESEDIISISPRAREPLLRLGPEVSATPILPPEKPKGKELVTISSSSSEDEDCVILSPAASEEESEPEDPNNSGMHTNDLYNTPDDQGRVLINVGHPKEEPDIFLAPQIARQIKPHQIGGLRFLYDNVVESLERFNTSPGFGCILAHSMGLGKTLQVVAFCEVFLKHTPARTVLCIMPINTLQNWLAEFNMWLPEKLTDAQLASGEAFALRNFPLLILNDSHKSLHARAKVIREWYRNGGVLLMGYELYRQLSLRRDKLRGRKKGRRSQFELPDIPDEGRNKQLWDDVHEALVKPGPDLVICDEGHRIKNSHASISHALKSLSTKRRVVLTGYPLQNNLLEYWCMVDFVRPNYLGTKTEFCNMFERPIQNGQCIDSTPQDIRLMRYRAHVLHSLLEGFVQRRSHSVLQVSLPQKEEYVLLLRMTAFQRALYNKFMNEVVRVKAVPNPLKAFAVCCKIWNHPDVLYYFLKKHEDVGDVDLDIEEAPNPAAAAIDCPPGSIAASVAAVAAGAGEIIPKPGKAVKGRPRLNAKKEKPSKPAASINPTHNPPKSEDTETKAEETVATTTATTEAPSLPATIAPSLPATNAPPTPSSSQNPPPSSSSTPNYPNFPNYQYYDANSSYTDPQYNQQYQDYYNQQYYPEQYPNNPNYYPQQQGSQNYPYWQQGQYSGQDPNYQQNYQGNAQQAGFYGNNYPNANSKPGETFPASSEFPQGNFNSYPNSTPGQANPAANQNTNGQPSTSVTPATSEIPNPTNLPSCQLQSTGIASNIAPPTVTPENSVAAQPVNPAPTSGNLPPTSMLQNHLANPIQSSTQPIPTLNGESVPIQNGLEIPPIANGSNMPSEIPPISQPIAGSTSQLPASSTSTAGQNGHADVLNGPHVSPENSQSMTATPADVEALDTTAFRQFSDTEVKAEVDKITEAAEAAAELKTETSPKAEKQEPKEGEEEEKKDVSPVEGMKFPVRLEGGKSLLELGTNAYRAGRDEPSISYDWATELLRCYEPGHIESCAKMEIMFCILEQSILLGDRMLVFSQSLFTLNLIEDFLQRSKVPGTEERWARNLNYYRLDGSTSALEREKLINEYNSNPKIHLFLVSTRAGSLGINLVGANRVVVFDASWNPCHDTQAVCRVYRYGQRKPCFVYRLVMDHCLEKKIYDRQINKQGMADRVVDELNPDAHLSIKDVSNLLYDSEPEECESDFSGSKDKYIDVVLQKVLARHSYGLSKEPFQHESLLVDRKEKKLSQAERRLAKRNYELEKQATLQPRGYPNYSVGPSGVANVNPPNPNAPGLQIRPLRQDGAKPIASVRPMQAEQGPRGHMVPGTGGRSRWIPAEVWQRQGMSAQEMTLPLDVVIPTNSPDRASIVLKAGQRVMVLKSPKGIYMQLENGKIIAIRTALKMGETRKPEAGKPAVASGNSILANQEKVEKDNSASSSMKFPPKVSSVFPLKSNSEITITPRTSTKPATNSMATVPPNQKPTPFSDVVPGSSQWRNEQRPNTKPTPGRPPAASNQHFSQPTRPFYHQQNRNSATVAPEVKDIPIFDVASHEFSTGTTARSSTNYQPKSSQQQPPPSYQHFQQQQQQQQPRQEDYTAPRSTSSNYQQPFDNKSSYVSSTVQSSTSHTMSESSPMHRHQQSRQQPQQTMPPMSQHAASSRQQQQHFPQVNASTPSHPLGMSTQVKPQEMAPLPALQHHLSNSLMHDKHKVSNNPPNPGRSKTGAKPGRPKKINRDSFEFSEESKATKPFVSATKSAEKPAVNDFGYQQGNEYFGSQQYSAGYYPPQFPADKKKEEEKKKETRSEVPTTTSPSATSTMYNTSGGGIVAASQPPYSSTDPYTQGQYPGYPNSYRNSTGSTYPTYPPFNPQYPEANSSMYSAFHRPEPFATGSDISSFLSHPFMPSSTPHFPASSSQSTTSPYYPQNVYPPTPGYSRSPYPATSVDPYSYPTGFNPFLVPSTPGYSIPSNPAPSEGNNSQ